jgi:phosphomannomutase
MENIFRAYDIRGIFETEFGVATALEVGLALGTLTREKLKGGSVSLGSDIRTSSPAIHAAVMSGLMASGVEVHDAGTTAFGETLFGGWRENTSLIVFITASHLPPEQNGVKIYYGSGIGLEEEMIKSIRDLVVNKGYKKVLWDQLKPVVKQEHHKEYILYFLAHLKPKRRLKVVVDCGNGSMCLSAPEAFKKLGYQVYEVFCDVDAHFPNRPSEPEEKHLGVLKQTVIDKKADLGVAFDGDGDRIVVVDNKGRVMSPDELGVILGKNLIKKGDCVLANVESSMIIEHELIPLGARVKRIRVGHTFLTLEAKAENAKLGIEKSGHIIIPHYLPFDDALIVPVYLGWVLSMTKTRLSEMKDLLPVFHGSRKTFDSPDGAKFKVIETLQKDFSKRFKNVNTLDGVRVDFDDGWVLIRASNTSPIIRMTLEANNPQRLGALEDEFCQEMKKVL